MRITERRDTTSCSDRLRRTVTGALSFLTAVCMLSDRAGAEPPASAWPEIQAEAGTKPASLPQVTVEAQRQALRQRMSNFTNAITRQVSSHESLARWHGKVCPLVAGLPRSQGEFVLERISAIAQSAGASLGPQDCKPNLFVMFTTEPARLMKEFTSRNASRLISLSGQRAEGGAVRRFIDSTRPIRAWYNVELVGTLGNALDTFDEGSMGGRNPVANHHPVASRIRTDEVQNVMSVLIVVDAQRIDGIKIGAVADYIAMLGLAEINLDADLTSDDSVLRLFTVPKDVQSLSQLSGWDAAFLKGLYSTEQASATQRSSIVEVMMRDTPLSAQP